MEQKSLNITFFKCFSNSFINQEECQCPRTCMVTVYDAIIEHLYRVSKIPPTRKSQLLLYFTSKGITVSNNFQQV